MVDTDIGLTCGTCGLVIDEGYTFVVQEQLGKNGAIHAHEIFHGNTTTMVGTRRERSSSAGQRLAKLQQRIVSYDETKRSGMYHVIKGAAHGLQLPVSIVDHAMHVAGKLVAIIQRGSMLSGPEMLAALSLHIAAKRLGIAMHKEALLDVLGLERKRFDRCLLRIKAAGQVVSVPAGKQLSRVIFDRVLAAVIKAVGEGHHREAIEATYKALGRAFVGLHEDSIVAVTAFMALHLEGSERASLSAISEATGYRSASLYNAATRVLRKLGIEIEDSLSKLDIAACLRDIVPVGRGIVKETPVPVVAIEESVVVNHAEPEIEQVEVPVIEYNHFEPDVECVQVPVIETVPAPRPTMTRSIPVSTNASPSGLVVRRFGAGRPPRTFYTNSYGSSNISRELFIAVRRGRGRPRKYPIPSISAGQPRALRTIYAQESTGPPLTLAVSPG